MFSKIRIIPLLVLTFSATMVSLPISLRADDLGVLSSKQEGVAKRYEKLEELLLRLADVEATENPERSALLRRAAKQSRDKFVLEKLKLASASLKTQEFQKAVENQEAATKELGDLLKLLMSEDRSKRIRDEKERYTKLIKDLKRNLNNQRSARARTENGADIEDVQGEQKSVTEQSEKLKSRLEDSNESDTDQEKQNEPKDGEPKDGEPKDGEPKDGEPKDGEPKDGEPKDGEPKDGEPKDGEPKDGEPKDGEPKDGEPKDGEPKDGEPKDGEPKDGEPKDGEPKDGEPKDGASESQQSQQAQSPEQQVEQQLKKAIENMKQAEKELEDAKREQATEKQRDAEDNLRAAIDRLEQILRQLREEELLRELAKLEARLRKMAVMQSKVLDDTVTLAATPQEQRNRQTDLKSGDLAFSEKKITLEADRAMLLLREEGSSIAFPEVVSQIRADTATVSDRLGQTKIDTVTQGIQQDILAALDEMITALQKAQRDMEQKQQQQQQGQQQQSGQGEQPLVEALAELKLIRTMETRIKSTTDRYSSLLESGSSTVEDVLPLLQNLSARQNRLYRITRDLVLKRNQ
jgi:hypothetical protein